MKMDALVLVVEAVAVTSPPPPPALHRLPDGGQLLARGRDAHRDGAVLRAVVRVALDLLRTLPNRVEVLDRLGGGSLKHPHL